MGKITGSLARAVGAVLALLLAALVLLAVAETVAWTLFEKSWAAASEIEGILLIWFGILGAAWGIHHRTHIGVEVLARRLPVGAQWVLDRAVWLLVMVFGALLAFYGAKLARTVTNTLPATGLEASVQYFPAAVGGALMVFFAFAELFGGGSEPDEPPDSAGPADPP